MYIVGLWDMAYFSTRWCLYTVQHIVPSGVTETSGPEVLLVPPAGVHEPTGCTGNSVSLKLLQKQPQVHKKPYFDHKKNIQFLFHEKSMAFLLFI